MTTPQRAQALGILEQVAYDLHLFLVENSIQPMMLDEAGLVGLKNLLRHEEPNLWRELCELGKNDALDSEFVWRAALAIDLIGEIG